MADNKRELPEGKRLSIEQEERLAKLFSGYRTPRSGGGNWVKGDVATGKDGLWFVEAKTTVKPSLSYSVNKAVLDKADHERAEMHKPYYTLAFTLGENREDYFVVNKKTMRAILEQQEGIRTLLNNLSEELTELELRRSKISLDEGRMLNQVEQASYSAHKAEKLAIIKELEKLI